MSELTILPVKPGTISEQDKATLREVGVVMIECDNPSDIRLLRPSCELDASVMLSAAIKALSPDADGSHSASVNRTSIDSRSGRWDDGIAWDELQRIKREIGRGHLDAVEVFPCDRDVVNVANMRHLFIFDKPLPYVWRK